MSDDSPPTDPTDRESRRDHDGSRTDDTTEATRTEPPRDGSSPASDPDGDDHAGDDQPRESNSSGLSDRAAFWISLAFGLALATGSVALVSGRAPFFEEVLRIRPTVEGGGVGTGWLLGNTEPILEWLIVLVHFADVALGIFILVIVFIHWAAFRRLAARMQPPGETARDAAAATDGGSRERRSEGGDASGGEGP